MLGDLFIEALISLNFKQFFEKWAGTNFTITRLKVANSAFNAWNSAVFTHIIKNHYANQINSPQLYPLSADNSQFFPTPTPPPPAPLFSIIPSQYTQILFSATHWRITVSPFPSTSLPTTNTPSKLSRLMCVGRNCSPSLPWPAASFRSLCHSFNRSRNFGPDEKKLLFELVHGKKKRTAFYLRKSEKIIFSIFLFSRRGTNSEGLLKHWLILCVLCQCLGWVPCRVFSDVSSLRPLRISGTLPLPTHLIYSHKSSFCMIGIKHFCLTLSL